MLKHVWLMPCVSGRLVFMIRWIRCKISIYPSVCLSSQNPQPFWLWRSSGRVNTTDKDFDFYMQRRTCRLKTMYILGSHAWTLCRSFVFFFIVKKMHQHDYCCIPIPHCCFVPLNWATSSCIGSTSSPRSLDTLDLAGSLVSLKPELLDCAPASCRSCWVNVTSWLPPWLMSLQLETLVCRCCDQGRIIHSTAMKRAEVVSHVKSLLREKTLTHAEEFDMVCCLFEYSTHGARVDTLKGVVGEVLPVQVCCQSLNSYSLKLQWSFQEVMTT